MAEYIVSYHPSNPISCLDDEDEEQAWQSEQSQLGSANSVRERAEQSGDSQARDRA